MREVVLGTAGHVDHGKTSLVKALTGIDTDRLKEEKERGITIELGFAYIDLPCGRRLGIVDVPGHERFIKNMVAGAAGIDLVAFVIAADEGIMPQTREHFDICRLLGVKKGCVVITKKDIVEPDWLELVQEEVGEFFQGSFLEGAPIISVSSTTGEGIETLRQVLDQLVSSFSISEAHGPFRLPVDRIFTMKGFGAVVTGTAISGRIGVGDDIVIYPREIAAKIRGIQVHSQDATEVEAGRRTAINIQGLDKMMIERGNVVASAGSLQPAYMYDAGFMYLSGNEKNLKNRTRVRIHIGTAEIMGRIALLDHEELEPGMEGNVQILLEEKFGCWPGDHYVVRSYSPVMTIGGGVIFNNNALRKRRFKKINEKFFLAYREGSQEDKILLILNESHLAGMTVPDMAVRTGVFGKALKKVLEGPLSKGRILVVDSGAQRLLDRDVYEKFKKKALEELADYHQTNPLKPGVSKEEFRTRIGVGREDRLFAYLLNDLIKSQTVVADEAIIRLSGHKVALGRGEADIREKMEKLFLESGLKPPTLKEIMDQFQDCPAKLVTGMIGVLVNENRIIRVTEDLYFAVAALNELREQLLHFLRKHGEIDAQGMKSITGLTRKFSIPLLEYFDKQKMTIRIGDKRVLRGKAE